MSLAIAITEHGFSRRLFFRDVISRFVYNYLIENMASNEVSSISSDSSNCEELSADEFYSSDSEVNYEAVTSGYVNEPEYTESELAKLPPVQSSSENSDNDDVDDLDSSRMENLHWCRCKGRCVIQPTLKECKCCREYDRLLHSKLNDIDCITQHEAFPTTCYNKIGLEIGFILHRRRQKVFKEFEKMSNK